ncbi:MAG: L-threonylcarbamoyladenylate synthase, partial [bacterium]|nr:L-threonylcarbamoyladenylate synthase [bacterium]
MEVIRLDETNLVSSVARAAAVLRAGGVILYPTDTLYGLGADALSDDAVAKIYAVKGREEKKPVHAIVSGLDMAAQYAELTDDVRLLAERLPQGQVTFILKKKAGFDSGIVKGIATFGFRIPDSEFCIALVRESGKPITATSANVSGQKPERSTDAILEQLMGNQHSNVLQNVRTSIDVVIDAGELPERLPSTVVDFSGAEPVILREGAISAAEVW